MHSKSELICASDPQALLKGLKALEAGIKKHVAITYDNEVKVVMVTLDEYQRLQMFHDLMTDTVNEAMELMGRHRLL